MLPVIRLEQVAATRDGAIGVFATDEEAAEYMGKVALAKLRRGTLVNMYSLVEVLDSPKDTK